ncbi:MAG TPA: DUF4321 domain-containing protein [Fibrobacteria bacterium]|nr:DUF4321 domain-containing protein [Fibrobacteria bacterium]
MKATLPGAPRIGRTIVFVLLGLILGGFVGQILAVGSAHLGEISGAGKENVVYLLLSKFGAVDAGFGLPPSTEFVLDLFIVKIKLGLAFKFNIGCIPGLILSLYLEKWSR